MADRELRVEEVLERLPVPRETLIQWLRRKELKGRRIAERKGGKEAPVVSVSAQLA
jgi:hypothetical protein